MGKKANAVANFILATSFGLGGGAIYTFENNDLTPYAQQAQENNPEISERSIIKAAVELRTAENLSRIYKGLGIGMAAGLAAAGVTLLKRDPQPEI